MKFFSENSIPALIQWCLEFNQYVYHHPGKCSSVDYERCLEGCLEYIFSMTPENFGVEVSNLDRHQKDTLLDLFDKISLTFPDKLISIYSIYLV